MRVLVTGASGYVGGGVLSHLLGKGVEVRALVRRPDAPLPDGVERVVVDLARPDGAFGHAVDGTHVVIHCAAHLGPGSRDHHRIVNVTALRALLDASAHAGVRRFVHVSTIAVSGWKRARAPVASDDSYDLHPDLRDDYAWSKICAERWVRLYRDRGLLDTATLRPGIVYGGGRDFVAKVWRRVRGPVCVVGGSPHDTLPLVHLRDTAEAIWRAASSNVPVRHPLIVVGPDVPTQREYLGLRRTHAGDDVRAVYVPFAPLRPVAAWLAARNEDAVPSTGSLLYSLAWSSQRAKYDIDATKRQLMWNPTMTVVDTLRELARTPKSETPS